MRYFIGFLVTIGLLILLIILLVSGGGSKSKVPTTNKPLSNYANTDAQASMTVDGPVDAQQTHTQIRISVGKDQVTYQKFSGYNGNVADSRTFNNNTEAYTEFLQSLTHAGFTLGDNTKSLQDQRGYCPLGNRYIFELTQGGQQIERYWTSDCGRTRTYKGAQSLTISLFEKQVPGFDSLDTGLGL